MRYPQNLHTHTVYCDGKDTPEEMILRAMELGFDTIGFSIHSVNVFSPDRENRLKKAEQYRAALDELKEKYQGRIRVLKGIEYEMLCGFPMEGYEYAIGSSHYLKLGEEYAGVDKPLEDVERTVREHFGGNGLKYAACYYENLSRLAEYGKFDIVGHFDLVSKYCERMPLFNTEAPEYRRAALDCLHELAKHFSVFEVNTGAIARGYRTSPYPAQFILKEMKRLGCGVILSSDCHDRTKLDCAFPESLEWIRAAGYDEVLVLGENGFRGMKLN